MREHICARRSKIKTSKAKKNYVNPQNIRFWKNQNAFFIQLTKLFLNPIMHMQCQSITGWKDQFISNVFLNFREEKEITNDQY